MSILLKKKIWIGLAEIYSLNDNGQQVLVGAKKGFVNALALARNRYDFRKTINSELIKMDLGLKRLENAELFNLRIKKSQVADGLKNLAGRIDENNPIRFGDFYVY